MAGVRGTHAYRLLTRTVRREERTCWLCLQPIDPALPYRDPTTGRVNTLSWSLDHVLTIDARPDLALDRRNARAAHFGCNSARGKGAPVRPAPTADLPTSRQW